MRNNSSLNFNKETLLQEDTNHKLIFHKQLMLQLIS